MDIPESLKELYPKPDERTEQIGYLVGEYRLALETGYQLTSDVKKQAYMLSWEVWSWLIVDETLRRMVQLSLPWSEFAKELQRTIRIEPLISNKPL